MKFNDQASIKILNRAFILGYRLKNVKRLCFFSNFKFGLKEANFCLVFILIILYLSAFPKESFSQYSFDTWTTNDGLPQNGVREIVQTPDGYIWFTTFDGLVRFDGVRFTVFNKSNSKGIDSNRFYLLKISKNGVLWAATEDGFLTIYTDDKFTSYSSTNGFPAKKIFDIQFEGEKAFLLTELGWFSLQNNKFVLVNKDKPDPTQKLYLSHSGTKWIIKSDSIEEIKNNAVIKYQVKLRNEGINKYKTAYEDKSGNLWVGDPSGLYCLKDGRLSHYTEKDGIPINTVLHSFWEEKDGSLWVATGIHGHESIGLIEIRDRKFKTWGSNVGFPNSPIFSIFRDRENVVWLATNKGLCRFRRQVITTYSKSAGLIDSEVYPILQSNNGSFWIGTTKGLSHFNEGQFTNYPIKIKLFAFPNLPPINLSVQSLLEDRQNRLWVGCIGALLVYENSVIENPFEVFAGSETFNALYLDKDGDILAGSNQGLFKLKDKKVIAHYTIKDGLPTNDIKTIYQTKQGDIWLGTYLGLVLFKNGKFTSYTKADGLAGNHVRSIYEDKQGNLWIGTYDEGLSRFSQGRFVNYKVEDGLFNNGVFSIVEDQFNNFWISSNKGIYRVKRTELEDFAQGKIKKINSTSYGLQDGLLNTECNGGRQPSAIRAKDGKCWFPTQDGVAVVDPKVASATSLPPPVVIESVSLEREQIEYKNGITVPSNKDDLEISYTGLSFINSSQIKFRYKLEGKDEDWVDAGTRRTVYYPFIAPGQYTFQVIAASSDGVWSIKAATFPITVQSPFWLKWWFWLSIMLIFATVSITIFRFRLTQLKKIQSIQVAFSHQLIESQEVERKRIAAELHDSLGQHLLVIKNWAALALMLSPKESSSREQLNEISDTASLALDEVRQIIYDLRPYQLDKIGLTNTLKFMLEQLANSSGIDFTSEIVELNGLFTLDQEVTFYRIVQECLNNIVKHSNATRAEVFIGVNGNSLVLKISDNGKGFLTELVNTKKTGFGLSGLAERVQMLGGEKLISSALGQGTTVLIKFDLKK